MGGRGGERFQCGDHGLLVGVGMVLAEFQLQLHVFHLEAEADDGAQLRAVFGARGIEPPAGLADAGFEAVADRADQFGQRISVVEGLQLATQLGSGVVPVGTRAAGSLSGYQLAET